MPQNWILRTTGTVAYSRGMMVPGQGRLRRRIEDVPLDDLLSCPP